ncbi:MAG: SixA phosphatase family protein [Thalassovita sp.]
MTLRLILMRHAKSDWDNPLQADHARPLNGRGRKSARAMGEWLRDRKELPMMTLSSDARRTQETVEAVGFGGDVRFQRDLYHAGPEVMLRALKKAGEATCILMVGHNPGIAEFAERLVQTAPSHPRFYDYPTCATLIVEFELAHWSDLKWGMGSEVTFTIPREVMRG